MTLSVADGPEIVLDLSRLMARVLHATPTGVDRVELAYARGLYAMVPERLSFAAFRPAGIYCRLKTKAVLAYLDETEALWNGTRKPAGRWPMAEAIGRLLSITPQRIPPRNRPRVYLQASPHHLEREPLVKRILERERARFVCLVHDLIPIEYPEYARPDGADLHRRRMATLMTHADALIANSRATAEAFARHAEGKRLPPVAVAHLGSHVSRRTGPVAAGEHPYFVVVGTIEPRKNHILLLKIWRRLVEQAPPDVMLPKLVLVGRRGWENENVVDMLDRCPQIKGHVIEASGMVDADVEDLVRGARALLLPSFAEGYGMPVAEALEMGVPVICSDLPALREVGGDVPEYLDPLDGPGWIDAIIDYAMPDSPRRAAQVARMGGWAAPDWQTHLSTVLDVCREVAR